MASKEKEAETIETSVDPAPNASSSLEGEKVSSTKALDGDDALDFLVSHGDTRITPEEDRRILWKIDLFLMPLVSTYC